MKSWISFLLPDDEYKEKKMLYFLSEGAVLLFLSFVVMIFLRNWIVLDAASATLLYIAIFLFYVLGRYIVSGIEYTDITVEQEYKVERRTIVIKSAGFGAMFLLMYLIVSGIPSSLAGWFEIFMVALLAGFFLFLINFVSLKRSYKRNKELL